MSRIIRVCVLLSSILFVEVGYSLEMKSLSDVLEPSITLESKLKFLSTFKTQTTPITQESIENIITYISYPDVDIRIKVSLMEILLRDDVEDINPDYSIYISQLIGTTFRSWKHWFLALKVLMKAHPSSTRDISLIFYPFFEKKNKPNRKQLSGYENYVSKHLDYISFDTFQSKMLLLSRFYNTKNTERQLRYIDKIVDLGMYKPLLAEAKTNPNLDERVKQKILSSYDEKHIQMECFEKFISSYSPEIK